MHQVNVEEAVTQLPALIHAAVTGEEVVITENNQPVVRLVPLATERPQPRFGSARGLIEMSDDFDAPLDEFADYLK
jgi:prevent-host-death family protein